LRCGEFVFASSIGLILVGSGAVTAAAGLTALLFPSALLRLAFRVEISDEAVVVVVRHWGVLLFVIGALIVYTAHDPTARTPVLIVAAVEKLAFGALMVFGRPKRTAAITAAAATDGVFAILYVAYLAGL
jgi:hypothetical protein